MIGFVCSSVWDKLSGRKIIEPTMLIDRHKVSAVKVIPERKFLFGILTRKPALDIMVGSNRYYCEFEDDDTVWEFLEVFIDKTKEKDEDRVPNLLETDIETL